VATSIAFNENAGSVQNSDSMWLVISLLAISFAEVVGKRPTRNIPKHRININLSLVVRDSLCFVKALITAAFIFLVAFVMLKFLVIASIFFVIISFANTFGSLASLFLSPEQLRSVARRINWVFSQSASDNFSVSVVP
jgi:hypothetical protein